jgi:hypothetical protein
MNKSYLRYAAFFAVPFLVIKVMTLAQENPANDTKPSAPVASKNHQHPPQNMMGNTILILNLVPGKPTCGTSGIL